MQVSAHIQKSDACDIIPFFELYQMLPPFQPKVRTSLAYIRKLSLQLSKLLEE